MSPDLRARLEKEAQQPAGVAPVMCCSELKQLLEDNARLVSMVGALLPMARSHCSYTGDEEGALVIEAAERTLGQVAP